MGSIGGSMIVPWKKQALDHPERIWIRTKDHQITYGDLANRILIYTNHLRKDLQKSPSYMLSTESSYTRSKMNEVRGLQKSINRRRILEEHKKHLVAEQKKLSKMNTKLKNQTWISFKKILFQKVVTKTKL